MKAGMPETPAVGVKARSPVMRQGPMRAHLSRCSLVTGHGEFLGQHRCARVAVVMRGRFRYRAAKGEALLTRGALLIGAAGQGYEKLALHPQGDLCLVFEYGDDYLSEASASLELAGRPLGQAIHVPAGPTTTARLTALEQALVQQDDEALVEGAHWIAGVALSTVRPPGEARQLTPDQAKRVLVLVDHLETSFASDCSLERLSALVNLSPFHLLRLFKSYTGQTPRQFLLAQRLAAAADGLRRLEQRVIDIALDSGFSDLSHFNAAFRRCYGMPPTSYRAKFA